MSKTMHDLVQEVISSGLHGIESHVIAMNTDKQWDLRKYTDKDKDPANDAAYKAACAYYATILNLEVIAEKDLSPDGLFQACVDAGAIRKGNAYINSYEKIASVAGVKVKRFNAEYMEGRETRMRDLLRSGVPLVIYIGEPDNLDHVEACFGYVVTPGESLFLVRDPGWQNDTHIAGDRRMFHFEGKDRKFSVWSKGQRKAYKFGYYET